ncbi:hypothetical protein [Chryseobacterium gossypii]|uniref:hypothetical protein n=1 Tax=Chryseobacterium gossypii TaxID=3231602 RepID=UPI003526BBCF
MIVFIFTLHSCVHDEVYTFSDSSSKEYISKSLWKEDEKYIKNVKAVFDEYANKDYFTSNFGTIYWDYALTMGTNETFLEVPVIKNGKINFVLVVYKDGDRIFFKRKEDERSDEFFDILVFKNRNQLTGKIIDNNPGNTSKGLICYTVQTTWTWTNDDGSAGPTYTYNETYCSQTGPALPCQALDPNANCGGSTGGSGGSSGSGSSGGGYPYPQEPLTPCDKIIGMLSKPDVLPKIKELKDQAPKGGEIGVKFKADGTPSPTIIGGKHSVDFGDKTGYAGGYHNHTPTGIPMLSPPDIDQLLGFARDSLPLIPKT